VKNSRGCRISFVGIPLSLTNNFERFLMKYRKDSEKLKHHSSIFKKYLEGIELSEELFDYVINHWNKLLRNVFRYYITMLVLREEALY